MPPEFLIATLALAPQLQGPAPFTEEAVARGISYAILTGAPDIGFGVGVGFGDLDGDGDVDLVTLGSPDGRLGLYENDGAGQFVDRFDGSGLGHDDSPSGVSFADYDGDGRLDLYFSRSVAANRLYRNLGGFLFEERAAAAGVDDGGAGMGSAWGDVDGDGDLDLYVCNRFGTLSSTKPNAFFRNLGDGTFCEEAALLGIDFATDPTFQALFCDIDEDGDADLYISNDKGYLPGISNHLLRNDGGAFVDVTASSNTGMFFNSMGVALGDLDGNGLSDLYATNSPEGNGLLIQTTPLVFVDQTVKAGVESFRLGWATTFLDFDNDGALDLFVVNTGSANRLYANAGSFPLQDMAPVLGLADAGRGYGGAAADIDGDGDLDIAVANWLDRLHLFINHEGETRAWVRVEARAPAPNRYAVGAVILVRVGAEWQRRHVLAGSSYKSQESLAATFGLDQAAQPDEIRVLYPGGATRTLTGYGGARHWRVPHPALLGDADEDGVIRLDDLIAFQACWTGSGPNSVQEGCEFADFDGDGDIDALDWGAFIRRLGLPYHEPPVQPAGP